MYIPEKTEQDLQPHRDILYQSQKILYSRLELLNKDFKIIDSLEGNLIKDSYSIDGNSDVRRTYSCSLHISDHSFFLGTDNNIWLNKYIRPYIGYQHIKTDNIIWYPMGTFVFTSASYSYDATTHTLDCECSDLMCTLNGTLGGQTDGLKRIIEAGEPAYSAITALLHEIGITNYLISDIDFEIPYDLEWASGTPISEMIKEILDLYSGYEMGFDIHGSFFVQKIPQRFDEPVVLDPIDLAPLLISENYSTSFSEVANHVQVWGKVLETDRYSDSSILTDTIYEVTIEDIETMEDLDNFEKIAFRIDITNPDDSKISINGLEPLSITDDSGSILPASSFPAGVDCVFKYRRTKKDFYYLGQYQVFGEAMDDNPDSPFCESKIGRKILKVYEGGEFEKIYSNDLALQRAEYEIWKHTTLLYNLNLSLVSIPWLDVNQKILYQSNNTLESKQYIIKSISGSSSEAVQSIEAVSFYPDYIYSF